MALVYKFNVLERLKSDGYNTNRLRKEKLLSESTIQKFRNKQIVSTENINNLCRMLNCQPGDILEYVPDNEEK